MNERLSDLSALLEKLCDQAVHETDPEAQAKISAEIYRVVAEREEIRKTLAPESES